MVSVYPTNVGAQREEQNVLLGCNVTALPANNYIEWSYYPTWVPTGFLIYSTYNGINNDPINFTVLPMTTVGDTQLLNLVINTATPELATQYKCDLSPIPGQGKPINVIVLDPLECSSGSVECGGGDEANISCSINFFGYTPTNDPMLTWYRDGQPISGGVLIDESNTRKTLTLTKTVTSADDNKKFVCVVDFVDSNPTYTDDCSTVVHVWHPLECSSSNVEYDEGDEANISCSVNFFGYTPTNDPTLTWYRDEQPISGGVLIDESNTRKTLTLTKQVTSADDDQEFVCVVDFVDSNPTYRDNCSTVVHVWRQTISVYPPNVGAQSGEQHVLIGCNVNGMPPNNYIEWIYYPTWMTHGFTIYSTHNGINNDPTNFTVYHTTLGSDSQSLDLVINTAKPELATQYLCRLTPIPGFGQTMHVIVLDPMECPSDIVEYDEGNEANLSCSVNYYESLSTMAPMVMWYRDGQPVPGVQVITESPTRKTARLTKNVTSADDDKELVCVVDFLDSNPTYRDNCSTVVHVW